MKVHFLIEGNHTLAVFGGEWADVNMTQVLCYCREEGHVGATPDYLLSLPKASKYKARQLFRFIQQNFNYTDLEGEF